MPHSCLVRAVRRAIWNLYTGSAGGSCGVSGGAAFDYPQNFALPLNRTIPSERNSRVVNLWQLADRLLVQ